jgi:hypothetical protein
MTMDRFAAKRVLLRLLGKEQYLPRVMITDELAMDRYHLTGSTM